MFRARARWWLLLVLVLVGGCRCGDDPNVGGASASFRPQAEVVDFGRVLEGTQVRRSLTLVATGRAGVTVDAVTDAPFFVVVSQIVVGGSGTGTVDILFSAGNTPVEGELVLTAGRTTTKVKLTGVGVRPLACVPQGECRDSRFDLDSGQCIESPLDDGASCIPSSRCQENGRCQAGVCVGQPRTCDDDNPCTVDSCSPTQGCVTASVACPASSDPCKVGVCDRNSGCQEVDVADFSPCGAVSCKAARVCFSGTCRTVTPPDGFVCAPATPCQGEGKCSAGECMRPDAGDLESEFSAELGGTPIAEDGGPVLLVDDGTVYASVCGEDGGCWLAAYTESGLLRYESPYGDGGARTLLAASDAGVVVLAPEALEAYAPRGAGELRWRTSLAFADAALDGETQEAMPGTTGAGELGWRTSRAFANAALNGGAPEGVRRATGAGELGWRTSRAFANAALDEETPEGVREATGAGELGWRTSRAFAGAAPDGETPKGVPGTTGAGELGWRTSRAFADAALDGGTPEGVPGTTGAGRVALTKDGDVLTYVTWSEDAGTELLRSRLVLLSADEGVPLAMGPEEDGGGAARLAVDDARGAYLYTPWDGRLAFTAWAPAEPVTDGGISGAGFMSSVGPYSAEVSGPVYAAPRVARAAVSTWPGGSGTGLGFSSSAVALGDAGIASLSLEPIDAGVPGGAPSLALASGRLLVGAQAFVDTDGGTLTALDWDAGTRTLSPLAEPVLMSPGGKVGHVFASACDHTDGTPCTGAELRTVLRSFSSDDGQLLSEVDVLPSPLLPGAFHEAALLEQNTVGVLADAELPNGQRQAWLEWIAFGNKLNQCALPGRVEVAGAVFAGDLLHVALRRDGVWRLEAYPVGSRAESRGWPQRNASPAGTRRTVP
ncbi:hypothetical protein [Corallococcus sp. AS-1-12]|uniref:hypothetical protein n=1 Tax=Corallococcus sp. AS-1-12 TaxID=2874598 RepID=UPI001CBDEF6C|nr:hypothetical protein [Corallococcus sp. AS-1-12]MBZ4335697.1 hypothetical protein [Corallococcus sp. AS-1-12]